MELKLTKGSLQTMRYSTAKYQPLSPSGLRPILIEHNFSAWGFDPEPRFVIPLVAEAMDEPYSA